MPRESSLPFMSGVRRIQEEAAGIEFEVAGLPIAAIGATLGW